MTTPELKPCPHCGNKVEYQAFDISGEHHFECLNEKCGYLGMFPVDWTSKQVIAAWNRRPVSLPAVEEAIKPCCQQLEHEVELLDSIAKLQDENERLECKLAATIGLMNQEVEDNKKLQAECERLRKENAELKKYMTDPIGIKDSMWREVKELREALLEIEGICIFAKREAALELIQKQVDKALHTNQEMSSTESGDFQTKSPSSSASGGKAEEVREPSALEAWQWWENNRVLLDYRYDPDSNSHVWKVMFYGDDVMGKTPFDAIKAAMKSGSAQRSEKI